MSFHEDWCDIFNTEKRCTCGSVFPYTDDPNPEHVPSARRLNKMLIRAELIRGLT